MNIPKHSQHFLLQFTKEVTDTLFLAEKSNNKSVGSPKKPSLSATSKVGHVSVEAKTIPDVGNNNVDNGPEICEKLNRCCICPVLSNAYCTKCRMRLCFKKDTAFMISTTRIDMCHESMNQWS